MEACPLGLPPARLGPAQDGAYSCASRDRACWRVAISVPFARGSVSLTSPPRTGLCLLVLKRPGGREKHSATGSRRAWLAEKNMKIEIEPFLDQSSFYCRARGSEALDSQAWCSTSHVGGPCLATEQVDGKAQDPTRNRQRPRVERWTGQREHHTGMRRRIKSLRRCIYNWPLSVPLHCQVSADRVRRGSRGHVWS